jgi:hypothetical protein
VLSGQDDIDRYYSAIRERIPVNKACTLLLVVAGGEPSDTAAFREHAAENCDAAAASRIGSLQSTANFGDG